MPLTGREDAQASWIEEFAPAKVNLCLQVTGRRPDGYHSLDSLVAFADVGDTLTIKRANAVSLETTGEFADALEGAADNLILKAAMRLGDAFPGAAISLNKALPVAAGVGGGSADAAAALRGLVALYDLEFRLTGKLDEIALDLGADVPACLRSKALRMWGIGERIREMPEFPRLPAVLVNPGVPVPTGAVFEALDLDRKPTGAACALKTPDEGFRSIFRVTEWLIGHRNDLEAPAVRLAPAIGQALDALNAQPDCLLARMSGSGATCFGLFETGDKAAAAAVRLSKRQPDWWVVSTLLH